MISSFPSYDEEQPLNSAYANISLIADKAWTFDKEDPFQKLNQSLWHQVTRSPLLANSHISLISRKYQIAKMHIKYLFKSNWGKRTFLQHCKVTEKYKENSNNRRRRRVHDVIPESRLAAYGNYEYNEERESLYKPHDNATNIPNTNFCWTDVTEPWMLPDVEKLFAWLTSNSPETTRELLVFKRLQLIQIYFSYPEFNKFFQNQPSSKIHSADWKIFSEYSDKFVHQPFSFTLEESSARRKPDECYGHQRYTIENSMEMQLHIRVTSEAVRSLWKLGSSRAQFAHQQRTRLPCHHPQPVATAATVNSRDQNCQGKERQQQFYYAFQYRPLILRAEYQTARTETYGMPRKHLPPVLSPEVPEFFPKISVARFNKEQHNSRLQYFPSLNERSYQNELFPYNRAHENAGCLYQSTGMPLLPATEATPFVRPPQQWYQRIPAAAQIQITSSGASPTCTTVQPLRTTITHHPLQVQEKFLQSNPIPIPVYQHPVELYHETGQKRKNQGVDFKNLILLTKNAMKAQRGLSKSAQLKPPTSYVLETRNRTTKSESKVLRWLDKGCTSKTKEFITANTLAPELRRFEGKAERKAATSSKREKDNWKNVDRPRPETGICVHRVAAKSSGEREKSDTRSRRRLYRDVLANTAANQAMFENVFEKRYDELEQQAMEQYRTSEESLALKYQVITFLLP
ncbi:uncharacterized protein LOC143208536 [Lasioglossum baleicum]|uniref:uncharacterized protein LOC143208536 n=1 Tax=Lasioglossum baleicum TaxID=434251 RepID=UPI003FCE8BFC